MALAEPADGGNRGSAQIKVVRGNKWCAEEDSARKSEFSKKILAASAGILEGPGGYFRERHVIN